MGLYFIVAYQYPVATTSVKNLKDETKASRWGSLCRSNGRSLGSDPVITVDIDKVGKLIEEFYK